MANNVKNVETQNHVAPEICTQNDTGYWTAKPSKSFASNLGRQLMLFHKIKELQKHTKGPFGLV